MIAVLTTSWNFYFSSSEVSLGTGVNFAGDGYVEFHKDLFPHQRRRNVEVITLIIQTTVPNGLFFWQGQQPGEQKGKDYLALALNDGYVEFGYEFLLNFNSK